MGVGPAEDLPRRQLGQAPGISHASVFGEESGERTPFRESATADSQGVIHGVPAVVE